MSRGDQPAIRRILVATDFSAGAQAALARANQLAEQHHARTTLLHAIPTGAEPPLTQLAAQALRAHADQYSTIPITTAVATGTTSRAITDEARHRHADLIVIGAHGAHWLHDAFIGSTAEAVVDLSRIPVLLVKNPVPEPYPRVLIAVDASPRSRRAIQVARALTPRAEHILAHAVVILGETLLRMSGIDDEGIHQLRLTQMNQTRPILDRLAAELPPPPVTIAVEPGRPEQVIPDLAARRHARLVVVGTEKVTGIRYAVIGSVARHTMRSAACDVLVAYAR